MGEREMDRAAFLRLIGAGASLSFLPASVALAGSAGAQAASRTPVLSGEEYPVGIWWPPPPAETSVERYREISTAGFDFVIGGNGVTNDASNPPALQAAAANGLRFILTDTRLQTMIRDGAGTRFGGGKDATPSVLRFLLAQDEEPQRRFQAAGDPKAEIRQRIGELLERYGGYPALEGVNLFDEPPRQMFEPVDYAKAVLKDYTPELLPYVNVWPSYASPDTLGASGYEEYLERYFAGVRPPLLCFDHYPLLSGTKITGDYFYNWATIRRFALKFGVPSWGFIQSVGFDGSKAGLAPRRRPNEREVAWQVNVALAYGAKGVQYFTYWTPDVPPDASIRFGEAMISGAGQRTPLYDYARRTNAYLGVVGKALLPLVSETVVHARERRLPKGAKPFRKDGYVREVGGEPIILSRFRKAGSTDRHLFVANRSFSNAARSRLKFSGSVKRVFKLDPTTGRFVRARLQGSPPRNLPLRIAPGAARLYLLRTG